MHDDGLGFVPDLITPDSTIALVAQNPGVDEERGQRVIDYMQVGKSRKPVYQSCPSQPLIGATGRSLDDQWLPKAGLKRADVSLMNILKCRWRDPITKKKTNKLPPANILNQAITHCMEAHFHVPDKTTTLVAMGDLAFDSLGGKSLRKPDGKPASITDYRGYTLPEPFRGRTVYCVLHPADLFYDRAKVLPTRLDWIRLGRLRAGSWPLPVPTRTVLVNTSVQVSGLIEQARRADWIACDTEFTYDAGKPHEAGLLTICGLAWEVDGRVEGVQIEWMGDDNVMTNVRQAFRYLIKTLVAEKPFVFWNAKADIPVLESSLGIRYDDYIGIHDGMLAHHCLWSQMGHTLEFVASMEGSYPKLKHISKAGMLALSRKGWLWPTSQTIIDSNNDNEPNSEKLATRQEQLETESIIIPNMERRSDLPPTLRNDMGLLQRSTNGCSQRKAGIAQPVSQPPRKIDSALTTTTEQENSVGSCASDAITAWGGSKTTPNGSNVLPTISVMDSPALLHNWGDTIETLAIWKKLWVNLQHDPGCREAYNKKLALIPILLRREREGMRVNQEFAETATIVYREKMEQANKLATSYAGFPINLRSPGADGQVATFLRAMEGIVVDSIDKDSIGAERNKFLPFDPKAEEREFPMPYFEERISGGAHPLLELRAMVAKDSQILNHYLEPLIIGGA